MKRFLTTTAATLLLSTSVYADDRVGAFTDMKFDANMNVNASELIGTSLYATEVEVDVNAPVSAGAEMEWDNIGEVNEIVLTRDGAVQSIIVGVGGFLGIGEKDVAIDMSQLKFVSQGDAEDDYFLVVSANTAAVMDAPAYISPTQTGNDQQTREDALAGRPMIASPDISLDGYQTAAPEELTAEMLTGARLYGPSDEDIGEVSSLLLSDSGEIEQAVLDIGGFLGLGEHQIAVTMKELQIVRQVDGDDVRVYIDSSKETLEAQPEYDG